MAKEKRDTTIISARINKDVVSRLDDYCNIAGQQKGIAIERAINMYIDDFEEKQKIIKKSEGHIWTNSLLT